MVNIRRSTLGTTSNLFKKGTEKKTPRRSVGREEKETYSLRKMERLTDAIH
jgi:hypothetical protein